MSKRILFRMHKQKDEAEAQKVVLFIHDYFYLFNQKVRVSAQEFKLEGFPETSEKMYDIIIDTVNDEKEKIAHAAGWSYLKGKEMD